MELRSRSQMGCLSEHLITTTPFPTPMSGIITGYGLFFIEKYFAHRVCHTVPFHNAAAHSVCHTVPFHNAAAHSVCHIVPPSNALLGRQNEEVIKVFLYFLRLCCACNIDYGRKRRTQCKFSAQRQGLALAVVQRRNAAAHSVCHTVPFHNAAAYSMAR